MDLLLDVVKALAWPAAVIVCAIIFRKPLTYVITSLSRLRYKDFEAEFHRQLSDLESEAQALPLRRVPGALEVPSEEEVGQPEFEALRRWADIAPRAAIVEAWREVEMAALEGANRLSIPVSPRIPSTRLLETLFSAGVIDADVKAILNRMRELRNRAVHAQDFELATEEAIRYINLAFQIVQQLRLAGREQ